MLKLAKYLKEYTLQIIFIFGLVFIQVMTDLQLPDYMSTIVNEGILGKDTGVIWRAGGKMLFVALISAACSVAVGYLAAKVGAGFSMNMRNRVFDKVEHFSFTEFDKFSTASLITRSTNDIQQIQMVLIMILRMVLSAPIMAVGAVIKAVDKSPSMTWIMALAVTILIGTVVLVFSIVLPKFKSLQKLVDKLNLVTRENLTGLRVIRAFNRADYEEEKFEKANQDLTQVNLFVNRTMIIMQPFMMLLMNVISITIIWVGAHMIDTGSLMVGDMMAFMQYTMQLIMSFLMITMMFIMIPRASVSAVRIAEILDTEPTIRDPKEPLATSVKGTKGVVEFKDVNFSYPGAASPVLEGISFAARPGETTAFIGSTGSGKSTLINLIPRFYDVTDGQILIDGQDIRMIKQEQLREKIGYVPQKAVLFSGTVESNVKYGAPSADYEKMVDTSKIAQAYDFIDNFEEKFETPIAQGGTNVSGGQKQRLSIARAIIKDPKIYIFDDSFSALDFKTDAILRKELGKRTKESTVLLIAQRISTIMKADKIIVLEEGKIAGMGTHEQLMANCDVYKEIALSQLSEEELA